MHRLREWTQKHGAGLCPGDMPDTFGEGMRCAKREIRSILNTIEQERTWQDERADVVAAMQADDADHYRDGNSEVLVAISAYIEVRIKAFESGGHEGAAEWARKEEEDDG